MADETVQLTKDYLIELAEMHECNAINFEEDDIKLWDEEAEQKHVADLHATATALRELATRSEPVEVRVKAEWEWYVGCPGPTAASGMYPFHLRDIDQALKAGRPVLLIPDEQKEPDNGNA